VRIVRILAAVIALLGVAAVSSATAAEAATLSGVVEGQRPEKEPERVAGVDVTVFKSGSEEKVAATLTSEFGKYAVEIPPGVYDVRFVPGGLSPFEPLLVPGVEVTASRELSVTLKYGGPGEEPKEEDTQAPLLNEFGLEPERVDVSSSSRTVQVFAQISDNLSGVEKARVVFNSPNGKVQTGALLERIGGGPNAGDYLGKAIFEQFSEAGAWRPTVILDDAAGNERELGPEALKEAGFASQVVVESGKEEEPEEEDGEAPSLIEFTFGPSEVDVRESAQKVHVEGFIADELSGVLKATVSFKSPSGEVQSSAPFERFAGNANAGTYQTDLAIERFSEAGTWLATVTLVDVAGNERVIGPGQLKEDGFQSELQVISEEAPEEEDGEAPNLKSFFFEPSEISNGSFQVVHVKAFITDNVSGVAKARVSFLSPSGEVQNSESLERIAGSAKSGTYITKVPFERFSEAGAWLATVTLVDAAGNERVVGPKELKEDGFASELQVFEEEAEDVTAPQLGEFGFSPQKIDVTASAQKVNVGAFVTDEQSGVAKATVSFRSPSGEVLNTAPFELVSGSPSAGTYQTDVFFEQFSEAGTWLASVRLVDAAGNERVVDPKELKEDGFASELQVESVASPPDVTAIEPSSGSEAGGTLVTISGSNLSGATQVSFGSAPATEFLVESGSTITALSPTGTGTVDVTVTTAGGTSEASTADRFTYTVPVTLTSTPNPSTHGEKVTLTASVAPLAEAAPTPLGTVSFVEGTTTLGVVNLKKGTATLKTSTLGAGKHPIVARYSGDSSFPAAESKSLTQLVDKAATELTLTSSLNPAPFGSSATLKATVKAVAPGAGTPAGTVTFSEGETVLGTVQLSGANANFSLKSVPPGKHEILASYSGDANDEPSQAGTVQTIVKASTEASLTSTLNPAPYGSSATLKASVDAIAPGGGTPTGTVTFYEGENVLAVVPLSGGNAKLALKSLSPGLHSVKATYSGDADYLESAGGIEQTITKASTELTLTSSKNPAPKGSSGTLKATVKALASGGGTPNGSVTFSEGETVLAVVPLSGSSVTYPLKALVVGSHGITASYSGSANYEASAGVITQVITP
jgi:Bacterial Ig-like domain (group 3)/IPT/TIG domain/Bacterial Ig-like domain